MYHVPLNDAGLTASDLPLVAGLVANNDVLRTFVEKCKQQKKALQQAVESERRLKAAAEQQLRVVTKDLEDLQASIEAQVEARVTAELQRLRDEQVAQAQAELAMMCFGASQDDNA